MNILIDEHKRMLLLLVQQGVEFMLIGGYAVIYYGYSRSTADMDIWIKPSEENKIHLLKSLEIAGIDNENLNKLYKLDFTGPLVFSIGEEPYKIDFLTKVMGVEWEEAVQKVNYLQLNEVRIPVIYYHHLVITKMLADREVAQKDLVNLQRINSFRKKNN